MFIRNPEVLIRDETFGGMAFHKKTGTTIELDHEGQYLIGTLEIPTRVDELSQSMTKEFHRKITQAELMYFIGQLIKLGFITRIKKNEFYDKNTTSIANISSHPIKTINCLSAPETVHLTITNKCNLNCQLCYEMKNSEPEMSKEAIFAFIDELAKMKVFQLAIGGGEPFLRQDIFEIVDYCQLKGIVPNITTNGTLIDDSIIKRIKHKVGGISVSLNGYSPETNIGRDGKSFYGAVWGLRRLLVAGIPTGVNVLVSSKNLPFMEDTFNFLTDLKVRWINVLRLKPGLNNKHLNQFMLTKDDLKKLKKILDRWSGQLKINVDTALTCLMHTIPIQVLRERAVYGCTAGIRFCTIDCNGDVYPCSFFKDRKYKAGNILSNDFHELWWNSLVFKQFREMRKELKGKCSVCRIREHCGGCRSIALELKNGFYGEDSACIENRGG